MTPLWGRGREAARLAESERAERESVLAHAAQVSPQWLTQYGARTGSPWAADVFAWLLSEGATDAEGLSARLSDGRSPEQPGGARRPVEPNLLARYVRMLVAAPDVRRDEVAVLLDHLAPRLAKAKLTRSHLLVLAQAYAGQGRTEEVLRALARRKEDDLVQRLLLADTVNPWCRAPEQADPDRWWELVDALFVPAGLEPVRLEGVGRTPFDRLAAHAGPVESPASVTVLMSCFRPDAATVASARSVVAQSWQDWELLVLDDASGPDHDDVLDEIAALDPRVRVIRGRTNAGTYVRRNEGLAAARGEFVTMNDSDDWSHPRRLERQVTHALAHPELPGNWLTCLHASDRLEFVTDRSGRVSMLPAEPTLLFRREQVVGRIGYYDPVRRAADREYRARIEAAFGTTVPDVSPDVPLLMYRVSSGSLSAPDFAGSWVHPARLAYRGAFSHWHRRIAAGTADPYLDPAQERRFPAPQRLVGGPAEQVDVDVLLLLDVRPGADAGGLLDQVVVEIEALLAAGRSVAVGHLESLAETLEQGVLPDALQDLVQDGRVHRALLAGDTVTAARTVVRTATAVQGLAHRRLPVTTTDAVLVEDPSRGGDRRGETFALHEALASAEAMLGVRPAHLVATQGDAVAAYDVSGVLT